MNWTNQTFKQLAERAAWRAHLKPRKKQEASSIKHQAGKRPETDTIKKQDKNMKQFKIIKTQGTKDSMGAFMVVNKEGQELFDKEGNNAWDTYQEAEKVLE